MARKLRKFKINLNPIKRLIYKLLTSNKRKRKKNNGRRIRKSVIIIPILIFILIFSMIKIPVMIDDGKLKDLGYSKEEIAGIRSYKLTKTIIENKWYSDYLAISIKDKSLKKEYIELYLILNDVGDKELLTYHRLLDKGYSKENILTIFKNLKHFEITPLLVFDYQEDINTYIEDATSHRDVNNESHFELTNSYYTPYENTKSVPDVNNPNMLVNKTYYLDSTYTPYQIAPLSVQYASNGLQLASEAASALKAWCDKAISLKDEMTGISPVRFYASSAYRSFERQEELYNNYVKTMGQEKADSVSARPGFSEHQTGYAVDLAALKTEGLSSFVETEAYTWASANAQDFGFILRYPEGKKAITGYDFESWHYRYVGVELAKLTVASNLTYDEFYMLYLAPWNDETFKYDYMPSLSE